MAERSEGSFARTKHVRVPEIDNLLAKLYGQVDGNIEGKAVR